MSVTIPTSWESGEKKVLFVASDGVQAPDSSARTQGTDLDAQADGDGEGREEEPEAIEFHIEPGDYHVVQVRTAPDDEQNPDQRHMDTLHVAASNASGSFDPSPVTISDEDDYSARPKATSSSPTRSSVPNAGDAFPLGLFGAALAAAGAATVAYERRRAENESEGN